MGRTVAASLRFFASFDAAIAAGLKPTPFQSWFRHFIQLARCNILACPECSTGNTSAFWISVPGSIQDRGESAKVVVFSISSTNVPLEH